MSIILTLSCSNGKPKGYHLFLYFHLKPFEVFCLPRQHFCMPNLLKPSSFVISFPHCHSLMILSFISYWIIGYAFCLKLHFISLYIPYPLHHFFKALSLIFKLSSFLIHLKNILFLILLIIYHDLLYFGFYIHYNIYLNKKSYSMFLYRI